MQKVRKTVFLSALFVTKISAQNVDEKSPSNFSSHQDALYNLALEITSLREMQARTTQILEELHARLEAVEHPSGTKQKSPFEEELEFIQRLIQTQVLKYQDYQLAREEVKSEKDRISRKDDKLSQKLVETNQLKETLENEKKILEIALAYQKGPPEILIQKMEEVILACDELTAKLKGTVQTLEADSIEDNESLWSANDKHDDNPSIQQTMYTQPSFAMSLIQDDPNKASQLSQTLLKSDSLQNIL